MTFTRESIDRVRDAVNIVELINEVTPLQKKGSEWKGLCPFHEERTPSLSVDEKAKLYHCFGCGVGGDAIRFVMETASLEFQEAVTLLAERYKLELTQEEEDWSTLRRRRFYALLNRVTKYYSAYFWEASGSEKAREYLKGRGFSESTLKLFRIGFAPDTDSQVTVAALKQGFTEDELVAVGISQRRRGGILLDRFRGRIMFPLADERGRIIGFGARATIDSGPKYVNTSSTELYRKGQYLYGMDIARPYAIKRDRIVVVEGYTDVLALHQIGVQDTVAIMGTSLTQEQLMRLSQVATRLILALDPDKAGDVAGQRIGPMADNRGLKLHALELVEGSDPADLISREGAKAFETRIMNAMVPDDQEKKDEPVLGPVAVEDELSEAATQMRKLLLELRHTEEEMRSVAKNNQMEQLSELSRKRSRLRRELDEALKKDNDD